MKKLVSLLTVVALIAALFSVTGCQKPESDKKVLKVYTSAGFPPYEYLDSEGNVTGVDIDVVNYIAKELGYEVELNDVRFDEILNYVQNDVMAVGAAGMTKKPDRDEVALASSIYATSIQYVIAEAGAFADGATVTADDLLAFAEGKGKGIGAQIGTTGLDFITGVLEGSENLSALDYANAIIASNDIGTSISAVVVDKLPAESICAGNDKLSCWQLDADVESYVMYFNLKATDLVAKVNALLEKMIQDGTIDQFVINHSNN